MSDSSSFRFDFFCQDQVLIGKVTVILWDLILMERKMKLDIWQVLLNMNVKSKKSRKSKIERFILYRNTEEYVWTFFKLLILLWELVILIYTLSLYWIYMILDLWPLDKIWPSFSKEHCHLVTNHKSQRLAAANSNISLFGLAISLLLLHILFLI